MNQHITWKQVNHPDILPGYLVSPEGYIKANDVDDKDCTKEPTYHSTNGYDFMLLYNKDKQLQLFPIDDIIALTYIPIPKELKHKPIKVLHINGDTRDISLDNLQWIEDVEEWRECTYPNVKPGMYEVSSWGRIRHIIKDRMYNNKVINSRGYITKNLLCIDNLYHAFVMHRIACWEFCNKLNEEYNEVNHIDGDKIHNIPKNLEWVNHDINVKHAIKLNMTDHPRGDDCPVSKLNEDIVKIICKEFINNWGNAHNVYKTLLLQGYDITLKEIQHIKHKECWSWLSDEFWSKEDLLKLHIEKINIICKSLVLNRMDVNKTFDDLSSKIPFISKRFIQIIKYKEKYNDISDKYF